MVDRQIHFNLQRITPISTQQTEVHVLKIFSNVPQSNKQMLLTTHTPHMYVCDMLIA